MTPVNGSSISRIRKIAAQTDSAHNNSAPKTVAFGGANKPKLPNSSVSQQISSAIHLVVQVQRLLGGRRRITRVSELTGMEGDQLQMHDIFTFEQTGVSESGHAIGEFRATGIRPRCMERVEAVGLSLPPDLFARRALAVRH